MVTDELEVIAVNETAETEGLYEETPLTVEERENDEEDFENEDDEDEDEEAEEVEEI